MIYADNKRLEGMKLLNITHLLDSSWRKCGDRVSNTFLPVDQIQILNLWRCKILDLTVTQQQVEVLIRWVIFLHAQNQMTFFHLESIDCVFTLEGRHNFYPRSFLDKRRRRREKKTATSTWEKSRWIKQTVLEGNGSVHSLHLRVAQPFQPQHKDAYNINHIQIHATYATVTFSVDNFFAVCLLVAWLLCENWKELQMELAGTLEHSVPMYS